jgi:5-methyltetrahydrofolate--homocysteine methyltransferase
MADLLAALRSGRVLLMDGAMGTELQRAGLPSGDSPELWNLTHPETVAATHRAYFAAGAEVLLTNTFQANTSNFSRLAILNQLKAAQEAGLALAREVAGTDRLVLLDIGPSCGEGASQSAALAIGAALRQQADGVLVETCSDLTDVSALLDARHRLGRTACRLAVLLSWTFRREPDGSVSTINGDSPGSCVRKCRGLDLAALGANCGRDIGMDEMIEIMREFRKETHLPLFARPNAGTPERRGDRWIYPLSPATMAARLPELVAAGATMIGGCCGTTPEHIAALRAALHARMS